MVLWIGMRFVCCPNAAYCRYLVGEEFGHENSKSTSKETAFAEWMRSALEKSEREQGREGLIEVMGNLAHEIAPHSYKKYCSETMLTMEGGPPATSCFLRTGQNLNSVVKRYVRDDRYSDELCGRILAGYRTFDVTFGTLPPRVNPEAFPDYPDGLPYEEIIWNWDHIRTTYPNLIQVITMGLASVVHHTEWLLNNLPADHAFHHSLYITRGWHSRALLRRPGGILVGEIFCPITNIRASGVPLYILNSIQITELTKRVNSMENKLDKLCDSVVELANESRLMSQNTSALK